MKFDLLNIPEFVPDDLRKALEHFSEALGELKVEDIEVTDLGLTINAELGFGIWRRGEWVQTRFRVGQLRVWVFEDTRNGNFKVAYGNDPIPFGERPWLTAEQAYVQIMWAVVIHVTPPPKVVRDTTWDYYWWEGS